MLVLSRKAGEEITVGPSVKIRVLQIRGSRVRLGISAPQSMPVHRGEVQTRILYEIVVANPLDPPILNCAAGDGS